MYLVNTVICSCSVLMCSFLIAGNCQAALANSFGISSDEPLPNPVTYFALQPEENNTIENTEEKSQARFNHINTAGNPIEPIPANLLTAGFYPLKIDVGGLLLGAVVGLGALVIVPKLVHLLSNEFIGYGNYHGPHYGRHENGMPESISRIVSQVEETLKTNNVNSTVCVQKAICSYIQSILNKLPFELGNGMDQLVGKVIRNNAVNFLIDGSKFKSAVEDGMNGSNCGAVYSQCPFTQESVINGIKQMITNNISIPGKDKNKNNKFTHYNNENEIN